MYTLVVLLPLLGYFSGSFCGRFLGRGVIYTTTLSILNSFFLSLILFYDVIKNGVIYKTNLLSWITVDTLKIDWCFCFDSLTSIMLIVVTFISTLVHLYSIEYMKNDPHLTRFMSYLSLFTFFMLILITANNFLQMFVGWEGVGLSSYLLINFWFTRIQANKAAIKAMLINRIGDFFLLLSLFVIFFVFNTLDYDIVFTIVPLFTEYTLAIDTFNICIIDLICLLLFLGAMGKSAQLGLHVWLPDAMEGPTPVSALIHAATMVTAGVFLIARCSFIFEFSPFVLNIITLVGATTAFFAATTGLFQNDIKRVIAYSTCSQLGYMIFACGLSSYEVGIFHLSNHAFFKALLFLAAGSIIHAVSDEQDMRKMGGLQKLLPFSYSAILIGSLALIGFPFLSGFYSKDVILEIAYSKFSIYGHYAYILGSLSAFFTAFYSTRLLHLVFLANPNGNRMNIINAHEGSWQLTLPLFLLIFCSILIGYLTQDFFIGFGTSFWGNSLLILPQNYSIINIEFIDLIYKLIPFFLTVIGSLSAYFLYTSSLFKFFKIKNNKTFKQFYYFITKKWYFDKIYNEFLGQAILNKAYFFSYKIIDRGLIENVGPYSIINSLNFSSNKIRFLQSGNVFQYLLIFTIMISVIIFWVLNLSLQLITLELFIIFVILFFFFNE